MKRVGFLTSGGDCQALNATMRGVAKGLYQIYKDEVEIIGFEDGYKGLMYANYLMMKQSDFSGVLTKGGTMLGTSRQPASGWGLDYLWWWLAKQHGLGKFAVVDEIGMLHTRAVGTAMSGGAKSNPRVEEDALYEKFNFRKEKPRTLSYNTQPLKILANKIFNHRNYCTKRFY